MQTIIRHTIPETSLLRRSQNMKKLLLAALIGLSIVSISGRASAGEVVRGKVKFFVSHVDALGDTGVYFAVNRINGDSGLCQRLVVEKAAPNFNTVMSLLLTASVSKSPLDIYAEHRPDHHPVAKDFCTVLEITVSGF